MAKKKQILILVSVVIASFLFGSMVTAENTWGDKNSPFDDIWNAIFGLQGDVEETSSDVASLMEEYETTIAALESRILALEANSGSSTPDYDSGWLTFTTSSPYYLTVVHNLGTRDIQVYLVGRWSHPNMGIITHQTNIGGDHSGQTESHLRGCYWENPTDTHLVVHRVAGNHDIYWKEVRVLIWKLPPPP